MKLIFGWLTLATVDAIQSQATYQDAWTKSMLMAVIPIVQQNSQATMDVFVMRESYSLTVLVIITHYDSFRSRIKN